MPLLALGVVVGALLTWLYNVKSARQLTAHVGAAPVRPPVAYTGDRVFSLPQEKWGTIETLSRSGNGYCYGIRLRNGLAVVCREHDLVR